MNEPRFCKDCRHAVPDSENADIKYLRCSKTLELTGNDVYYLVTGDSEDRRFAYCAVARLGHMLCGDDAKLFEPALQSAELTFGDQP